MINVRTKKFTELVLNASDVVKASSLDGEAKKKLLSIISEVYNEGMEAGFKKKSKCKVPEMVCQQASEIAYRLEVKNKRLHIYFNKLVNWISFNQEELNRFRYQVYYNGIDETGAIKIE